MLPFFTAKRRTKQSANNAPGVAVFIEVRGRVAGFVDGANRRGRDLVAATRGVHQDFHFGFVAAALDRLENVFEQSARMDAEARLRVGDGRTDLYACRGGRKLVADLAS